MRGCKKKRMLLLNLLFWHQNYSEKSHKPTSLNSNITIFSLSFSSISDLTNDSKPNANNIESFNKNQPNGNRLERKRYTKQRPFRFPNKIEENGASESNSIRWPVDQPSNYAIDTVARHGNHLSPPTLAQQQKHWIRFPTPQIESENEASLSEHINFVTETFIGPAESFVGPKDGQASEAATTTTTVKPTQTLPSLMHQNATNNYYRTQMASNDADNEKLTVNQTANTDNILGNPMIYIENEHEKNIIKNASTKATKSNNARNDCMPFGALALPSINCTTVKDEAAIIFNENPEFASTSLQSTVNQMVAAVNSTNISFNTQMAINLPNTLNERETNQTKVNWREAELFNGRPIFE